jgi:hypothetical protein
MLESISLDSAFRDEDRPIVCKKVNDHTDSSFEYQYLIYIFEQLSDYVLSTIGTDFLALEVFLKRNPRLTGQRPTRDADWKALFPDGMDTKPPPKTDRVAKGYKTA